LHTVRSSLLLQALLSALGVLALLAAAVTAGVFVSPSASRDQLTQAQTEQEPLQAQLQETLRQIEELRAQLMESQARLTNAQAQLAELVGRLQERDRQIAELQRQLEEYRQREGSRTKVLFIGGLDSHLQRVSTQSFRPLQSLLQAEGYSTSDLITFSYAGGELNGLGEYTPAFYDCSWTRLGIERTYAQLKAFLTAYGRMRPDVSFVLVGHSFGGLLAFRALEDPELPVSKVVTIEAPLNGISWPKAQWAQLFTGCETAWDNGSITDVAKMAGPTRARNRETVAKATERGVTVVTVGNADDCYYRPLACRGAALAAFGVALVQPLFTYLCPLSPAFCELKATGPLLGFWALADESRTQIVEGATYAALWPLGSGGHTTSSHHIVIHHPQSLTTLVQLIGRPV
jgi:pimeloyl-ACP methyl ester carboxylesterase